jgi:TolB-like protein/DNA-binding winged helix-turn-helix (wHTH) protein/Tfp pilus assembly protein PilF
LRLSESPTANLPVSSEPIQSNRGLPDAVCPTCRNADFHHRPTVEWLRRTGDLQPTRFYEFGQFRLDRDSRLLWRDDEIVSLTPKVIDLLLFLVENKGGLITKHRLLSAVWPETFVEESNLTSNISILRKSLGQRSEGGEYIETIPKRGYRFVAPIREFPSVAAEPRASLLRNVRMLLAGILVIAVAAGAVIWNLLDTRQVPGIKSVVVLPFLNLSADRENEYFSDGLTEELIDNLSKIKGLHVVSRTSAFQFKGEAIDIRQIGRRLNVEAVLEGSVRKYKDRLRVTAQLNTVANGYHLWSRTYDKEAKDALSVQQEIAQSIAQTLRQDLPAPRRVPSKEAHELYLQARYHRNRSLRPELDKAITLYQQAIAKDPNYAEAYAGLAFAHIALGFSNQLAPREAFPQAADAARKALALDPLLADAHATQGMVSLLDRWDWVGAEKELREAIRLNPSYAVARHWYSHYLVAMGKFDQSLEESTRAIELEPVDLPITAHLGWHYLYTRQCALAAPALLHSLELDSRQFWAWEFLRRVHELTNRLDNAIDDLERSGTPPDQLTALRHALKTSGSKGYWTVRLQQALALSSRQYVQPLYISQIYLQLGEIERAFESLEQGFQARDSWLIYLKQDPGFDTIRNDGRFVALTRRVGLP